MGFDYLRCCGPGPRPVINATFDAFRKSQRPPAGHHPSAMRKAGPDISEPAFVGHDNVRVSEPGAERRQFGDKRIVSS